MKNAIWIIVALVVVAGGIYWWTTLRDLGDIVGETDTTQQQENPPNSAEGAPEGSIHNLPVPEGVAAARAQAAADAGVSEGDVLILTAFERDWPDACLGLAGAEEMCAQVITPGYEVTAQARGQERVYRTNEDGSVVREEN